MITSLVGTTAPTASIGIGGDYYINTTTDRLYGPKGSSIWPSYSVKLPINLPTSAVVLLANQSPVNGDGSNGDYYIDISNNLAYGPKTSGVWNSGTVYTNESNTIRYGSTPPDNSLGLSGDFYIDISTSMLYGPKTSTWPTGVSLIGPSGEDGEDGEQGPDGEQGERGPQGATLFLNTLENKFIYGTTPPSDILGRDGDLYLNTLTNTFYGPKNGGKWNIGGLTSNRSSFSIPFWLIALLIIILVVLIGSGIYIYFKFFSKV